MAYNSNSRKRSEDLGSGVCRSIIHYNDRQPEPEGLLYYPPYLPPMVVSRNDNGKAER
jgi:hypothetical protein